MDVASGVSEQPRGRAETITGAQNRAQRALDAGEGADCGVGIDVADGLWAAVTDGDGLEHDAGAAGVFTGGAIDRQSALEHAVAGGFGPFVTSHY